MPICSTKRSSRLSNWMLQTRFNARLKRTVHDAWGFPCVAAQNSGVQDVARTAVVTASGTSGLIAFFTVTGTAGPCCCILVPFDRVAAPLGCMETFIGRENVNQLANARYQVGTVFSLCRLQIATPSRIYLSQNSKVNISCHHPGQFPNMPRDEAAAQDASILIFPGLWGIVSPGTELKRPHR